MNTRTQKFTALAVSLLALAATVSAEIKLNENLAVSGYAVGSLQYFNPNPGASDTTFDLDAAKVLFAPTFGQVSGAVSFFTQGGTDDVSVLDAYATYNAGNGVSVTGGRYVSYLGFEAFEVANLNQITFANNDFLLAIPGYMHGVKIDYSAETFSAGLSFVDSTFGPVSLRGDGELKENYGIEGVFVYKGVKNLTVFTGFAYQSETRSAPSAAPSDSIFVVDVWAQYQLTGTTSIAAEFVNKNASTTSNSKGRNWLAYLNHAFSDKLSATFRVSGEKVKVTKEELMRYTVSPAYALSPNLLVRAEYSYTDFKHAAVDKTHFVGLQGVFKF